MTHPGHVQDTHIHKPVYLPRLFLLQRLLLLAPQDKVKVAVHSGKGSHEVLREESRGVARVSAGDVEQQRSTHAWHSESASHAPCGGHHSCGLSPGQTEAVPQCYLLPCRCTLCS